MDFEVRGIGADGSGIDESTSIGVGGADNDMEDDDGDDDDDDDDDEDDEVFDFFSIGCCVWMMILLCFDGAGEGISGEEREGVVRT
jgi:hypothetical protein